MFGEMLTYLVVQFIKCYAVMDIAGSYYCTKYEVVFVAGCMCFVRKTLAVFTFVENSAVRIGC